MGVFCFECDKLVSTQSNYNRHRREIHGLNNKVIIEYACEVSMFKCEECGISFKKNECLRHHLLQKHNLLNIEHCEKLSFNSYEEFKSWLSTEENRNNVEFERLTGVKRTSSKETCRIYWNCIRSGKFQESNLSRKRVLKSQGSKKLNRYCTSQIIVEKFKCGKCEVKYFKTHYGHENDLEHLSISKHEKDIIASKLILGVSTGKIVDPFRENIIKQQIHRSDIITKKYVNNIKQSYDIDVQNGCRHTEDAVSVDIWVREAQTEESNPVLFYKRQGELSGLGDQLLESDFCLILMNNIQAELLRKFGSNIVCIDSTHGLNPYDFELTSLLVIDEFGEGFPVACMFSNRKDTYINELFFTYIKNIVEIIYPKVFMTDITNTFYNAWCLVMSPAIEKRLFCSWHVDRAWQNNLAKVKESEKRKWVYKTLKYLQRMLDHVKFEEDYAAFISLLFEEPSTKEMGSYLLDHYSKCTKQWAYCYRKQCGISTNMHIENMHKNLKYTYLEGKKVKRLDKSLHLLQKFIRDKIIDRCIKLTKDKTTKHSQHINAQHRVSLTLKPDIASQGINNFVIKIPNSTNHYVKKVNDGPCCNMKCMYCNICIHTFECTCIDFNIKHTICKHIHCVCLTKFVMCPSESKNKIEDEDELKMLVADSSRGLLISEPSKEKIISEIESNLLGAVTYIKNGDFSEEQLSLILVKSKNIKNISAIKCNNSSYTLKDKDVRKESSNKNIQKQCFYSTKKRKQIPNRTNKKPNKEEQEIIEDTLRGQIIISTECNNDHRYL